MPPPGSSAANPFAAVGGASSSTASASNGYKANVQVCARIRPLLPSVERDTVGIKCRSTDDSVTLLAGVGDSSSRQDDDTFYFDYVFDETEMYGDGTSNSSQFEGEDDLVLEAAQQKLFDTVGKPLVDTQCRGVNTCVIVLGPTGGGKSHTLIGAATSSAGGAPAAGLAVRMLRHLEEQLCERNDPRFVSASLQLSVYEMYGEKFKDLILSHDNMLLGSGSPAPLGRSATMSQTQIGLAKRTKSAVDFVGHQAGGGEADFLDMKIRSTISGVHLDGIKRQTIATRLIAPAASKRSTVSESSSHEPHAADPLPVSLEAALSEALSRRSAASRSRQAINLAPRVHLFIDCTIKVTDKLNGVAKSSTMRFVDMCGSEKVNRVRQAGSLSTVHRSLHALRSVVDALVENAESPAKSNRKTVLHSPVVPYRDSLFTVLLSEALGGSCRTTVVASVSPGYLQREESLYILAIAQRMKSISSNVSTREEAVDFAVGALQKELTLLQQLAADAPEGRSDVGAKQLEQRGNLASELRNIETEMHSAVANREDLERQRHIAFEKLAEHDKMLEELQRSLQERTEARDQSNSLQQELSSVVQVQLNTSQQVANEVAMQEKRNAQILVHRQRQASIVRRHESMVSKLESAKQIAENNKRKELGNLFRSATILTKQRNDVRFYRSEVDRLLEMEGTFFTRLRELQTASSEAATRNSEEQLKCDFLTEELDEVVEQWETANKIRSDAITEHRVAMAQCKEQLHHFEEDIEVADAAIERYRDERHHIAFDLGIRVVELEAEVEAHQSEILALAARIDTVQTSNVDIEVVLERNSAEVALLPQWQTEFCVQEERRRAITNDICSIALECDSLEKEIQTLEEVVLPLSERQLAELQRNLDLALKTKTISLGCQESLEGFVQRRVFLQETKSATCSADPGIVHSQHITNSIFGTTSPMRRMTKDRASRISPAKGRQCTL
jgi:hypothetical protein